MIFAMVVLAGLIGVILLIITRVAARAKASRLDKLEPIAEFLGGHHDGSSKAWGTGLGPKLTIHLTTRGAESRNYCWTEIEVELPAGYPLEIHLRRHGWDDDAAIARR